MPSLRQTPKTDTLALARGTHRTRVSEMRLSAARAAAPRPVHTGDGRYAAAERAGEAGVREGTG